MKNTACKSIQPLRSGCHLLQWQSSTSFGAWLGRYFRFGIRLVGWDSDLWDMCFWNATGGRWPGILPLPTGELTPTPHRCGTPCHKSPVLHCTASSIRQEPLGSGILLPVPHNRSPPPKHIWIEGKPKPCPASQLANWQYAATFWILLHTGHHEGRKRMNSGRIWLLK